MFVFGTIGGTATNGDHLQISVYCETLPGYPTPVTADYPVVGGDTPSTMCTGLVGEINGNATLSAAGITATAYGASFVISYDETKVVTYTKNVIGVKTETLTIYDFLTLFWGDETSYWDFLNQIDGRLLILGDGPPTSVVPRQPGVFYYDRVDHITYRADYTDGLTIGGTSWSPQNFSLPVANHSTQGIVQLATQAQVIAGTDDATAVTPAGLAGVYARAGDNNDITQLEALLPRLDFAGGRGPWNDLSTCRNAILPTQSGHTGFSLGTDGSNITWQVPGKFTSVNFPTVSGGVSLGSVNILNVDGITLTLPQISSGVQTGDYVAFTPGNVQNLSINCSDGSRINNSTLNFIINKPFLPPFKLVWSGVTYGWVMAP